MNHKKYIVFIDYGSFEGWRIQGEADTWEEAIALREQAHSYGAGEVIVCEYIPLLMLDGRRNPPPAEV